MCNVRVMHNISEHQLTKYWQHTSALFKWHFVFQLYIYLINLPFILTCNASSTTYG
jgi:hypothetical protein